MRFISFTKSSILLSMVLTYVCAFSQRQIRTDELPAQWQYSEAFDQTIPTSDRWWDQFGDQMLDSLIRIGIDNNYDILTAQRRIEMARQAMRQTRSQYMPTLSASAGYAAQRSSGVTTSNVTDAVKSSVFDLGLDMSWQIDVFGRVYERAKGDKAAFRATNAEYAATMVTVSAKIATAYMQLRTMQTEVQVLQAHIAQQQRVAEITQARHEAGLASMLDVAQSLTTFYSTTAALSSLQTNIATTINSIAVLLGVLPDDIRPMLQQPASMPDYRQVVGVGIPMDLIRRRPDIAQAEYMIANYASQLGVAKKDFLPVLSLSGSIGTTAHSASDLFSNRSLTYSIAPTLSWTIFDGMARNAAVASAKEQMMIGIDNYNSTVLTALQEVDNAMTTYVNYLSYIDTITMVVEQAEKSFDLSIDLYKQGLTDFINVSNAEISYLTYSNELIEAKGQTLAALINLYQALGGGWSER